MAAPDTPGRTPHVLISGASIAGPALAERLLAYGWEVTLVERSGALRDDGQNIDIRGAGREVARRMGIEDAIRAAGTREVGTRFVDASGRGSPPSPRAGPTPAAPPPSSRSCAGSCPASCATGRRAPSTSSATGSPPSTTPSPKAWR
jgi:hypothetical protein